MRLKLNVVKRIFWKIKNIFHKYSTEEKATIKENKKLIKEFPFLLPRNRFSDLISYEYDYLYTELDELPSGWRKVFGMELCQRLKTLLLRADYLNKYRIMQIKEKYGTLRWYSNGVPTSISREYFDLINYYEDKSMLICLNCGQLTSYQTDGWIEYICEDCLKAEKERRPKLTYSELTWEYIPSVTSYENNKKYNQVSKLKGDMMVAWKRYSKYNNLKQNKTKDDDSLISPTELW